MPGGGVQICRFGMPSGGAQIGLFSMPCGGARICCLAAQVVMVHFGLPGDGARLVGRASCESHPRSRNAASACSIAWLIIPVQWMCI